MGLKTKGLLDTQVLVKNPTKKAGEMMSWWLRALPALPEDQAPTLIPGTVELWSERHSKTLGRLSQIPFGG